MDNFDFTLDLSDTAAPTSTGDFPTLPDGTYELECVECIPKITKAGGTMWAATFVVIDPGKANNRKIWHNFNVVNSSAKAQQIARAEVKRLLTKKNIDISKSQPTDLIGIKVDAKVATKDDPEWGAKNIIQSFITEAPAASSSLPF